MEGTFTERKRGKNQCNNQREEHGTKGVVIVYTIVRKSGITWKT